MSELHDQNVAALQLKHEQQLKKHEKQAQASAQTSEQLRREMATQREVAEGL